MLAQVVISLIWPFKAPLGCLTLPLSSYSYRLFVELQDKPRVAEAAETCCVVSAKIGDQKDFLQRCPLSCAQVILPKYDCIRYEQVGVAPSPLSYSLYTYLR